MRSVSKKLRKAVLLLALWLLVPYPSLWCQNIQEHSRGLCTFNGFYADINGFPIEAEAVGFSLPLPPQLQSLPGTPSAQLPPSAFLHPSNTSALNPLNNDLVYLLGSYGVMLHYDAVLEANTVVTVSELVTAPVFLNNQLYGLKIIESTPGFPATVELVTIGLNGIVTPGPQFSSGYALESYFHGDQIAAATDGIDELYFLTFTNLLIISNINSGNPVACFINVEPGFNFQTNWHSFYGLSFAEPGRLLAIHQSDSELDIVEINFDLVTCSATYNPLFDLNLVPPSAEGWIISLDFYSNAYLACQDKYYFTTIEEFGTSSSRLVEVDLSNQTFSVHVLTEFLFGLELVSDDCCNQASYDCDQLEWAEQAGGIYHDYGGSVAVDADGNIFTTGTFMGTALFGPHTLTSSGLSDAFVAKQDPAGNFIWASRLGGTNGDSGIDIALAPNGYVYVSGHQILNTFDAFVACFDQQGQHQWTTYGTGSTNAIANSVAVDDDGFIYFTGNFYGSVTFGQTNLQAHGLGDVFVVKMNHNQTTQWVKHFGGDLNDAATGIAVDNNGKVFVTGSFEATLSFGTGLPVLASAGEQDAYLVCFDDAGVFQWAERMGGPMPDFSYDVVADSDGSSYIVGYMGSVGPITGFCPGNLIPGGMADIFVAKFLDDGTCSWTAHFEGVYPASIGKGFSIALNHDETFVFTSGVFTGTIDFDPGAATEHRTSVPGSVDMYISLLTSGTGDYTSVYQMQGYNGGFDPDLVNAIIVDDNGCFYTTGGFVGTVDFNPDPILDYLLTADGPKDAFVQKFCCCCQNQSDFLGLVAQGLTAVVDELTCEVTISAPQFGSCHWFTTDGPFWGDGTTPQAGYTPSNNSWTHTYAQSGTYTICITVVELDENGDECWQPQQMCIQVTICCAEITTITIPALTDICRTTGLHYVPITYNGPCTVNQVQWYVKDCNATSWPTNYYQLSNGLSDLLILPNHFPASVSCLEVKALVWVDGSGCCSNLSLPLESNIGEIQLCSTFGLSINNPNLAAYCGTMTPLPLTAQPVVIDCGYDFLEWYYRGDLVSTDLNYQPPQLDFDGSTPCFTDHVFVLKAGNICGIVTTSVSIRIYDDVAPYGDLYLHPYTPMPLCYGEDATLVYDEICSGPPSQWTWYHSTTQPPVYVPVPNTGSANSVYNTNKLYETTWFMVEKQNGVCPPVNIEYLVEVKEPLSISYFNAEVDYSYSSHLKFEVHFAPSPVAGNCEYLISWYHNDVLLTTSNTSLSPTIYHHYVPSGQFEGYYYAVVQDDCCPYEAVSDVAIINPDCIPVIAGPCYKCNNDHTPITLVGDMIIPPDTPCPYISQCTYQWYDNSPGQPQMVIIPGATNLVLDAPDVGIYVLESNCNGLIQYADFTIERCDPCASGLLGITNNICVKVYPNPASQRVMVGFEPAPTVSMVIQLLDIYGSVLTIDHIGAGTNLHGIPVHAYKPGIYLLQLLQEGKLVWMDKVVIMNQQH
jgi:hypothetical protein